MPGQGHTRRGLRDHKLRSICCLSCSFPPHTRPPVLLRNSHTESGSLWGKGAGRFTPGLGQQKGLRSATDTKYVYGLLGLMNTKVECMSCPVTALHAYLPIPEPPGPLFLMSSNEIICSSATFPATPNSTGRSLAGSGRHSQLRLLAALFCSIGCSKERKGDPAKVNCLFLCWKALETALSVHTEQRKVGFCQGSPPVTVL